MTRILVVMIEKVFSAMIKRKRETKRKSEDPHSDEEDNTQAMEDTSAPTLQAEEAGTTTAPSRERESTLSRMTEVRGLKDFFTTKIDTLETKIEGTDEQLKHVESTVHNIESQVKLLRSSTLGDVLEKTLDAIATT